ncbi:MAG: hypothetical protein ACRDZ4_16975 [Egibacteraceae bacterium]
MTGVQVLMLVVAVAVVSGLVGAGLAFVGLRRAEARASRWLDQRAAERIMHLGPKPGGNRPP